MQIFCEMNRLKYFSSIFISIKSDYKIYIPVNPVNSSWHPLQNDANSLSLTEYLFALVKVKEAPEIEVRVIWCRFLVLLSLEVIK